MWRFISNRLLQAIPAQCPRSCAELWFQGETQHAGPSLQQAVNLLPDNGHFHNTLGAWHLQCGRGDAARQALEQVD